MSNEKSTTGRRGRPRTGSLIWCSSGWRARVTRTIDGEPVQVTIDLGTMNKSAARQKLARVVADGATPEAIAAATACATVASYAERHFAAREARGLRSVKDERGWFDRVWREPLGEVPLAAVRTGQAREVLVDVAGHYSRATLANLRGVLRRLFVDAVAEELVVTNPIAGLSLRGIARQEDERPRTVPTDEEIGLLLGCRDVGLELKMLVLLSRSVGGMRAGDLDALRWESFSPGFATCVVPRRKKRRPQVLDVPEPVQPFLVGWWNVKGCPTVGPVFPVQRGERAGEAHRGKHSHAGELRAAFAAAGCDRHELQHDTATSRRVDFHSLRRAYVTGLARAGVNLQTSQILSGHSDAKTHMRYVADTIRALPAAAMPELPAAGGILASAAQKFERAKTKRPRIPGATLGTRTPDLRFTKATSVGNERESTCTSENGAGAIPDVSATSRKNAAQEMPPSARRSVAMAMAELCRAAEDMPSMLASLALYLGRVRLLAATSTPEPAPTKGRP